MRVLKFLFWSYLYSLHVFARARITFCNQRNFFFYKRQLWEKQLEVALKILCMCPFTQQFHFQECLTEILACEPECKPNDIHGITEKISKQPNPQRSRVNKIDKVVNKI